jgi:hypothetical protein
VSSTTYSYKVIAFNAAGSAASNTLVLTTPGAIPAKPTNFKGVVLFNPTRVSLSWTNNLPAATSYLLTRTGSFSPVTLPGSATTYVDLGVVQNTTYTYTLVASIGSLSAAPVTAVVTVPLLPPNPPRNLTLGRQTINSIRISWLPSLTPPTITGYQVQVSTNGTTWTVLATLGPGVLSYTQTGLPSLTTRYYRVRAFITVGTTTVYSTFSGTVVGETQ